jgi:hypothetical protein
MSDLGHQEKALEINLNPMIYGTFAEIGAGQEVARHFFRAGGAAGTIAKSISAYDMTMSDAIYGKEANGRYVCQPRLQTMLDYEYFILVERLAAQRESSTTFFAFADSVAAKSFKGTGENHGWLGVKFQDEPNSPPSQVIMHITMLDVENLQQQEAVGLIGMNLVHAVYYKRENKEKFVSALMDGLTRSRLNIDMIKVSGNAFKHMDSRLLCLELVKNKLCEAVLFDSTGEVLQASDVLYKKNILVVRGAYRPPTNLSMDMLESGLVKFKNSLPKDEKNNIISICEISMSHLLDGGKIDSEDFLARVDLLSALGQKVLLSNSESGGDLNQFFTKYAKKNIAFVLSTYSFEEILNVAKYSNTTLGLIGNLGALLEPHTELYIYPNNHDGSDQINTIETMTISPEFTPLLSFLTENKYIDNIVDYNPDVINIWSKKVLKMIQGGTPGWEKLVPDSVVKTVKEKSLFGVKKKL